jgi:hypothetical protein
MIFNTILSILVWLALICLVVSIVLFFFQIFYPPVRHFIVTKIGIQTTGTVITSLRCDDHEDVCVCGVYKYYDRFHWEHKVKFRYCQHWPSHAEWDKVMQSCGPGAENTVSYLWWFPLIREIWWNVDNPNFSERETVHPEN